MGLSKWVRERSVLLRARYKPVRAGKRHTLPGQLVISLTSYPPRFPTLGLTLRSLLAQDVRPDVLVLWIAHHDREALPNSVTRLQRHGLVIRDCGDTRQYKKIIPALTAHPGAFIVTADDDVGYPRDWLRWFIEAYRHPREVLCQRARWAVLDDETFVPYRRWKLIEEDGATGPTVFLTGVGGVLYPPGSLPPQTTDAERFMRLCPRNDDIWLYWMASLAGCNFRFVKPRRNLTEWPDSQRIALWRTNQGEGENDTQIAAMVAAYGLPPGLRLPNRHVAEARSAMLPLVTAERGG